MSIETAWANNVAQALEIIGAKSAEIRDLHTANRRLSDALVIAEGQRDQLRAELTQAKLLKPLHPATIDDAIALLVREGAVEMTLTDWAHSHGTAHTSIPRRVLFLPTTGAAHE